MNSPLLLIVYVPATAADKIRETLGAAGAGALGNYDYCSFSTKGTGRFRPLHGANPTIGTVDHLEIVDEERIEVFIPAGADIRSILAAIKTVHPYESPAIHLLPLMDEQTLS